MAPVLHSLRQAEEDLAVWTADLPADKVWAAPPGLAPLGFQLKHIAGSIDRLLTYAKGEALSTEQMETLRKETEPSGTLGELLSRIRVSAEAVAAFAGAIDPAKLAEFRGVGRKQLPTTVIGLLVHIAEHTQRHVGQAIVTIRVLRLQH